MLSRRSRIPLLLSSIATLAKSAVTRDAAVVLIDFDFPRQGPICVSVDSSDTVRFIWKEYHDLHKMNEDAYDACDFSNAILIEPAAPNPRGSTVPTEDSFFSCSKICASNGHKTRLCVGGTHDELNACNTAEECEAGRRYDVRSGLALPREYAPVGRVCRPKNGDGYALFTGLDDPNSCRDRCEADAVNCGAWEFENYAGDDRECELHERSVVSVQATRDMGDCQITEDGVLGYRCCWILKQILDDKPDPNAAVSIEENSSVTTSAKLMITWFSALPMIFWP